jgi:hypothetical protein
VKVAAALLALTLALFAPGILQGRVFFRRDVHLMWYTQVETMVAAVLEGAWPLWNPYLAFGQPLWADANTQPLYPTTLLHLILKPWNWYSLYAVLHVWLAGWGTAILLRRLRASTFAALVGGALFMFSGPILSLVDAWNQLAGAAWMPWAAIAALDALRRPSAPRVAAWSFCLAAPVLAGSPEGLLMGVALSAACAYARFGLPTRLSDWRRTAGVAAAAALLGACLSAGQWLPSLEATTRSTRASLSENVRTHWAVAPAALPQVVLPLPWHELPLGAGLRQRLFGGRDPFLPSLYLGLPALALVMAPVLRTRRRAYGTLGVLTIGAVVAALGPATPLPGLASALFPPLQSLRYPSKAMVLAAACWALLAGLGVDAWQHAIHKRTPQLRERFVVAALVASGATALGIALFAARGELGIPADALIVPEGVRDANVLYPFVRAAAGMGVTSLAMAAALLAVRRRRWAALALGLLPTLDLYFAHRGLNPMAPQALYTHRPALLSEVQRGGGRLFVFDYFEPGASRRHLGRDTPYLPVRGPHGWPLPATHALGLRQYLFPPTAGAWRVPGSFERDVSLMGPRRSDLLRAAFLQSEPSPDRFLRYLQAGAVGTVVALHETGLERLSPAGSFEGLFPETLRLFRVPDSVPRSYVAVGRRAGDPATTFLSSDFDVRREVALPLGGEEPLTATGAGPVGTSQVLLATTDRLRLDVFAARPAYVVAVDADDPHWSATVDGTATRIELANGAFRAVPVPAGRHVVEMTYRPWPVFAGIGLSALGMVVAAILCRRSDARKQRARA